MCILIRYNKSGKGTTGGLIPFYVARYLPAVVGQILYEYLVYIRPFIRYLQAQHGFAAAKQPHYLWLTYCQSAAGIVRGMGELDDDEEVPDKTKEPKDIGEMGQREAISSKENQGFWLTERRNF
jgi:hypothetical protein